MKKNLGRRHFLLQASLSTLAALFGGKAMAANIRAVAKPNRGPNPLLKNVEIYQQGTDKAATWLYAGFLPRMQDPDRMKIVASHRGLTVRVSLTMTTNEVAGYADYLYRRALQIESIRKGEKEARWRDSEESDPYSTTTPFAVLDPGIYANFLQQIESRIAPVRGKGYKANLQLMKDLFPMSVFERNGMVEFHIVFPTTPPPSAPSRAKETFHIHIFEERRTYYSHDGSHIFAGFPTFWFNGEVGFHGPIRFSESEAMLNGKNSDTGKGPDAKDVDKRWQLHRFRESHGCYRMEHVLALRNMLPSDKTDTQDQPSAQSVDIIVLRDFDRFDIDGDGREELMGVRYYWLNNNNQAPDEKTWKKTFYQGVDTSNLYEFPYTDPAAVQIQATPGSNGSRHPTTAMARLNRAPYGEE